MRSREIMGGLLRRDGMQAPGIITPGIPDSSSRSALHDARRSRNVSSPSPQTAASNGACPTSGLSGLTSGPPRMIRVRGRLSRIFRQSRRLRSMFQR
ncbi:MAG: hypothetical protein BWZ01_02885 [Deltaproteobacteria bacterium ADurb.BinA179]|nr:MAG: hypothetical protein BWZ01_02885 [Deltaproteobacteria bacterium ADurb.BinA179]